MSSAPPWLQVYNMCNLTIIVTNCDHLWLLYLGKCPLVLAFLMVLYHITCLMFYCRFEPCECSVVCPACSYAFDYCPWCGRFIVTYSCKFCYNLSFYLSYYSNIWAIILAIIWAVIDHILFFIFYFSVWDGSSPPPSRSEWFLGAYLFHLSVLPLLTLYYTCTTCTACITLYRSVLVLVLHHIAVHFCVYISVCTSLCSIVHPVWGQRLHEF